MAANRKNLKHRGTEEAEESRTQKKDFKRSTQQSAISPELKPIKTLKRRGKEEAEGLLF
jgi:hypothetical protein